jgi:hypothetical protein
MGSCMASKDRATLIPRPRDLSDHCLNDVWKGALVPDAVLLPAGVSRGCPRVPYLSFERLNRGRGASFFRERPARGSEAWFCVATPPRPPAGIAGAA